MDLTYYEKMFVKFIPEIETEIFGKLDGITGYETKTLQGFFEDISKTNNKFVKAAFLAKNQSAIIFNTLYQGYYFWKYKKRIYKVSDEVANALLMTDVDDLNTNYIEMPQPNIYLSFSNKYFTLQDPRTGIHQVEGIFITERIDEAGDKHWRVLVTAGENENSTPNEYGVDDAIFYYNIRIDKNLPVKQAISLEGDKVLDGEEWEKIYNEQMQCTIKFIINVLMYISTNGEHIRPKKENIPPCLSKKSKKIKRWEREYGKRTKLPYLDINDEKLEDIFKNKSPEGSTIHERIKWKTAWIVSGHWHTYWVGKGRTHTQVNWLQPYWKGENRLDIIDGFK